MADDTKEDPKVKAEREAQELLVRITIAKQPTTSELLFDKMVADEYWPEDKIALLKGRAGEFFKRGFLEVAASLYTRAIGMHACHGTSAPPSLYGNRSACRSGVGDYDGGLADAIEAIQLDPTWAKGYVRKGAALHGLFRLGDAIDAYEEGLKHDSSMVALSDGLNDALRRRKAEGGRWEMVIDGASKQDQATEITAKAAGRLLLVPGSPRYNEQSLQGQSLLCVDETGAKLIAEENGSRIATELPSGHYVAACSDPSGKDDAIYLAEMGRKARLLRLRTSIGNEEGAKCDTQILACCEDSGSALGMEKPSGMAFGSSAGASDQGPALYVCDSGNGRVLVLDAATFSERFALGRPGSGEGELNRPVSIATSGDLLAIAEAGNYRLSIFKHDGAFVRHIGERASKFATAPRGGHFVRPPGHVALAADGHLFVLEAGGATHIHVLDPMTGEAKALLQPPFNAVPLSADVHSAKAQQEAARQVAATLECGTGPAPEQLRSAVGCLVGLGVTDLGLYVATTHGEHPRVLRLLRSQSSAPATADCDAITKQAQRQGSEALAYKKGFLLDLS